MSDYHFITHSALTTFYNQNINKHLRKNKTEFYIVGINTGKPISLCISAHPSISKLCFSLKNVFVI